MEHRDHHYETAVVADGEGKGQEGIMWRQAAERDENRENDQNENENRNEEEKEQMKSISDIPSSSSATISPLIIIHSKDTTSLGTHMATEAGGGEKEELSLQKSFQKFLSQKRNERKLQKQCQLQSQSRSHSAGRGSGLGQQSRDPSFKENLRSKFIQQAKAYLGVPYAKKYQPEDGPEYPLYLDCCGLVRQVLKDLQQEFGFVIGKWNQAYQYDTLPIRYDQADQMKPGDLVFYSGEYSSKRSKLQKHDMVHVEIFLGGETGEATIGARYQKGFVQIFPSYKFDSKLWTLKQFHFCSLDTWLEGECRSHCSEHPWIIPTPVFTGGRSIFDEEEEESAGEDDLGDEEEGQGQGQGRGKNEEDNHIELNQRERGEGEEEEEEDVDMIGGGDGDDEDEEEVIPVKAKPQLKKATSRTSAEAKPKRAAANPAPLSNSSQTKLNVSRVNRSRSMDSPPKPKKGTATSEPTEGTEVPLKTSSKSGNRSSAPLTYYVGEGNGWRFIKTALDKRGWQQLPFEYSFSTRFTMKWVERRSQIDFSSYHEGQLVNHIPNNDVITTKLGMLNTLRNYFCCSPNADTRLPTPWLPETYQVDMLSDCLALIQKDKELSVSSSSSPPSLAINEPTHLWIYKPSSSNRGRGVKVLQGGAELSELLQEYHPQLSGTGTGSGTGGSSTSGGQRSGMGMSGVPGRGIVQEYIMRPLLVEGFKFDLRVYMLIACVSPFVAYYHPGYCRRTLRQYSLDIATLSDPIIHLSNTSIQKKSGDYKEQKENQVQLRSALADAIERDGDPVSAEYIRNSLDDEIKQCMVDIIKASKDQLLKKRGYFDLLGLDFMITNSPNNQTVLLEANTNPALCVGMNELITDLVDGTMELVLAHHGISSSSSSSTPPPPVPPPPGYVLIYDDSTGYEFTRTNQMK